MIHKKKKKVQKRKKSAVASTSTKGDHTPLPISQRKVISSSFLGNTENVHKFSPAWPGHVHNYLLNGHSSSPPGKSPSAWWALALLSPGTGGSRRPARTPTTQQTGSCGGGMATPQLPSSARRAWRTAACRSTGEPGPRASGGRHHRCTWPCRGVTGGGSDCPGSPRGSPPAGRPHGRELARAEGLGLSYEKGTSSGQGRLRDGLKVRGEDIWRKNVLPPPTGTGTRTPALPPPGATATTEGRRAKEPKAWGPRGGLGLTPGATFTRRGVALTL